MLKFFIPFVLSVSLQAQNTLTVIGPSTARPGQSLSVELTLSSVVNDLAGLQWEIDIPSLLGPQGLPSIGVSISSTKKSIYCIPSGNKCIAVGFNNDAIPSGVIAKYSLTIPPGASKGPHQISLSNLVAGDAKAQTQVIVSGPPLQIILLSRADINGDGQITMADLVLMIDQILGRAPCTDDQNGDGKCDLIDALAVVRAALDE